MQFNSTEFIFVFLPIFLLVYFSVREELRRICIVLGSLLFYLLCGGSWWWTPVLVAVVFFSWAISRALGRPGRGWLLGVALTVLAELLIFFKLYQGGRFLPAGMSFYLFQIAACLIDVYRGKVRTGTTLLAFAEQILLFPKLLSGPLMDPVELQQQNRNPQRRFDNVIEGLRLLILGLALKVIIASRLGGLFGQVGIIGYSNISTGFAWMALVGWAMQLYFDFYGYSIMAIGLGRMLGYSLPANFLDPYCARSVSEFYRRWHVTLGAWFREYLYIPLGGNRKGNVSTIVNLAVVWLFTGLWHGVGGNYLLWAGILFFFIVNERLWLGRLLKKSPFISHVYTVFAILLSWVPFAVGDWVDMTSFACRLFGVGGSMSQAAEVLIWGREYGPILLTGAFLATPLPGRICRKLRGTLLGDVLLVALFWVVVYFISTSAQDPFMYFQY